MSRSLAQSITRASERLGRRSIVALGAAGFTAALAPDASAARKTKKRSKRRCKRQVRPCKKAILEWVEEVCLADPDPPACVETRSAYADCCDLLGSCSARATLECLYFDS